MTEQSKNSKLAGQISLISLISFFVTFILVSMKIVGGLPVVLAGIGGLVGASLGFMSKNTKAIIFGLIPFVLTIVLVALGMYVKSQMIN